MERKAISSSALRRLPVYLHYLNSVADERKSISSSVIASHFGLNEVQVRKDLAAVSGSGRPKTGYNLEELTQQIKACLACGTETKTILVGAGNLGKALLSYDGFSDYGINIIAAFDSSKKVVGKLVHNKPVLPVGDLEVVCENKGIRLGIITTPIAYAQETCDRLVACGIRAIWNFAPTFLKAPQNVLIENENLASSLAILSWHLSGESEEDEK